MMECSAKFVRSCGGDAERSSLFLIRVSGEFMGQRVRAREGKGEVVESGTTRAQIRADVPSLGLWRYRVPKRESCLRRVAA